VAIPNHVDPQGKSVLPGQIPVNSIINNIDGEHNYTIVSVERLVELMFNPVLDVPFTALAGKEVENV